MQIVWLISFSSAFIEVEAVQVRGRRKRLFIRRVEKVSTGFLNLSNQACAASKEDGESRGTVVASAHILISGRRLYTFDAGIGACSTPIQGVRSVIVSRMRT